MASTACSQHQKGPPKGQHTAAAAVQGTVVAHQPIIACPREVSRCRDLCSFMRSFKQHDIKWQAHAYCQQIASCVRVCASPMHRKKTHRQVVG